MKIIGISGLNNSVIFKQKFFPKLAKKYCSIAQGFNSAASLIVDNKIIALAAEERFNLKKATECFPINAINYCLQQGRININQIDYIAHGFNYELYAKYYNQDIFNRRLFKEVYSREAQLNLLKKHFNWPDDRNQNFIQIPHHIAHAASGYYVSGYNNALILIVDGMGEKESLTVAIGEKNKIEILTQISGINSIGILYSVFTLYLGFKFGIDEYKVMGLASYGDPNKYFDLIMSMINFQDKGKFTIPALYNNINLYERETYSGTLKYIESILGPSRNQEEAITTHYQDVAAAIQAVLQTVLMHVLKYYKDNTKINNLVMAGGVALNCTANSYIKKSKLFANIFIQPASGDEGTSLGSALYTYYKIHNNPKTFSKLRVPYYGPSFSKNDIKALIEKYSDYFFYFLDNYEFIYNYIAKQLAKGKIIGWFQDRMEFGPRALGNRSILADPRDPNMKKLLNLQIKLREPFRPFAPAVTMEKATTIFEIEQDKLEDYISMLLTAQIRNEYKNLLPSITHIDGSARVQVVFKKDNNKFWSLINKFGELTGIPVLINTSFNINGQPIVCSVKDALDTFNKINLDMLVIDNCLITKNNLDFSLEES